MTADFQNSVLLHYLVKYEEYKIPPNIICTVRIILFFARRIKLTNTQMTQAAFFCRYTGFVTCNDVYDVIIIHAYTHTHTFNGPFSWTTQVAGTRKVKPIWILLKQETVSGSGIGWDMCKSAP